jgi:ABC-type polar amino acid transport system ATPase subunit
VQDAGLVLLDNIPLDSTNNAHAVGMVFQHFNLFEHLTVEQNITLPLERVKKYNAEKARTVATELLEKYGLTDKKCSSAARLSGGQKQRLAIARTLAMQPAIICLDEPTSALDPVLTAYVAQNIQEMAQKGYIVLVASHDTDLIEKLNCTIYLMHEGSIIETAPSSTFKQNPDSFPRIKKFIAGNA